MHQFQGILPIYNQWLKRFPQHILWLPAFGSYNINERGFYFVVI